MVAAAGLALAGCASTAVRPAVETAGEPVEAAAPRAPVAVVEAAPEPGPPAPMVAGPLGELDPRAPMPIVKPTERLAPVQAAPPARCCKPLVVWAEPITEDRLATPSSAYIEAAHVAPAVRTRTWEAMPAYYSPAGVTHPPLYFQDPFEDKEKVTGCGSLAWTWEDYLAIPYSDARWLLNTIALPVSLVVQPPWMKMCSDGEVSRQALGYDHDPVPCPEGMPEPYDLTAAPLTTDEVPVPAPEVVQ